MSIENPKTTNETMNEDCIGDHFLIEKGNTGAARKDLYDDITENLDQISALAEVARTAYRQERDINPCIMACYCSTFVEITNLLTLRVQSLREYDLAWTPESSPIQNQNQKATVKIDVPICET
jgi:hypothetical protein